MAQATIIIGAGHAGLAMSRALTARAIDHIILDQGGPGHAWRTERWDSLRMLTPNWANALPGETDRDPDPDGFMAARSFADRLERYAQCIAAPLHRGITVTRLAHDGSCFQVETDQGMLRAETIVNATGATRLPRVPRIASEVPSRIFQITPNQYRRPADLPDGGVLVVGASASGAQLAREIQLSGRPVTLATGGHLRLPRRYRGRDIDYWLHHAGINDERAEDLDDLTRARRLPSAQLIAEGTVDLNALRSIGVEITGRLLDIRDGKAMFSGGLAPLIVSADLKMHRLLDRIDDWIAASPKRHGTDDMHRPEPTTIPTNSRLSLPLNPGPVRTIIWATGYAADTSWIDLPVFDIRGRLRHDGGVCPVPGLFALGLPVLRRRASHQISGAAADTKDLSLLISRHLDACRAA